MQAKSVDKNANRMNISAQNAYKKRIGNRIILFNPEAAAHPVLLRRGCGKIIDLCKKGITYDQFLVNLSEFTPPEEKDAYVHLFSKLKLIEQSHEEKKEATCSHKSLAVWLHLTNTCNLTCPYCFVDKNGSCATVNSLRKFVSVMLKEHDKGNLHRLSIKFSGGEPLLKKQLIKYTVEQFKKKGRYTDLKIAYTILSNGTLIDQETIDFMREHRIGIGISLDGVGNTHDLTRKYHNGKGSFKTIESNIVLLKKNNIPLSIMATLSEQTIDDLPSLTLWLLNHKLNSRYSFVKYTDYSDLDYMRFCRKIIRAFRKSMKIIKRHPYGPNFVLGLEISELSFGHPLTKQPCGMSDTYLAVGCGGEIGLCPSLLSTPVTNISDNFRKKLVFYKEKYIDCSEVSEKCRLCQWYRVCATGCPQLNEKLYGHPNAPSPFCYAFKQIIPLQIDAYGWALNQLYRLQNAPN